MGKPAGRANLHADQRIEEPFSKSSSSPRGSQVLGQRGLMLGQTPLDFLTVRDGDLNDLANGGDLIFAYRSAGRQSDHSIGHFLSDWK